MIHIAPMMDVTDRHCRFFLRQVNAKARLYTEMITTGALIHGDVPRHLRFSEQEHPVALQLGGSEPDELAHCAKLGAQYGYDEINLNIGCPSERVQRGAFGACLMAEPALVSSCVTAIGDAVKVPVTVKHRIGIDKVEELLLRTGLRRYGSAGRLQDLHRPCAQCSAEGTVAERKPRDPAVEV